MTRTLSHGRTTTVRAASAALVAAMLLVPPAVSAHAAGTGGMGDMPGMDHSGAAPAASVVTTPSPKPVDGARIAQEQAHSGDHVDLREGDRKWKNPQTVAEAALVRVETWADVAVGLHHNKLYHYEFPDLKDPSAVGSGSFINSRGAVLTSRSALHDGKDQFHRFGVRAVNEAFVRHGMLAKLPADPFSEVHLKDAAGDVYLQSCYNWTEPESHCVVFVTPKLKVFPSIASPPEDGYTGQPTSDPQVSVLTTVDQHKPLTLQMADPNPGENFWAVASTGAGQPAELVTGTLSKDKENPVSGLDRDKLWDAFGASGQGAPIVSERGDVVGMLNRTGGAHEFEVVAAQHLVRDIKRFGASRDSSPTDTTFREGLRLFESQQYQAALPALGAAVTDTAGQRVPTALVAEAKKQAGTTADRSGEDGAGLDRGGPGLPWWLFLLIGVVLFGAALGALLWMRRRGTPPTGAREYSYAPPPADQPDPGPYPAAPAPVPGDDALWSDVPPVVVPPPSSVPSSVPPRQQASAYSSGETLAGVPASSSVGPGDETVADGWITPVRHDQVTPGPTGEQDDAPPAPAEDDAAAVMTADPAPVVVAPEAPTTGSRSVPLPGPSWAGPGAPAAVRAPSGPTVARPTVTGQFCRQCGSHLSPGDRFCYACGNSAQATSS